MGYSLLRNEKERKKHKKGFYGSLFLMLCFFIASKNCNGMKESEHDGTKSTHTHTLREK